MHVDLEHTKPAIHVYTLYIHIIQDLEHGKSAMLCIT